MNHSLAKLPFLLAFIALSLPTKAQILEQYWKKADAFSIATVSRNERDIIAQKGFTFEMNMEALQRQLSKAPLRFSAYQVADLPIINLPMPDGTAKQFKIMEAPVFHAELQSKFPNIRSYTGYDIRNPSTTVRFDVSLQQLSAMILSEDGIFFIDAYSHSNTRFYVSYDKKDFITDKVFNCQTPDIDLEIIPEAARELRTGDGKMRKYRLALAATAEYSKYHGATSVANVANVLAAMNKTMTRVNGVYEKEFSMTMEIIPNTDKLIFYNAATDGYTNSDGEILLDENQSKCNTLIGSANYDIGHVFSTGGGGIADIQSPCKSDIKARGVTGSPTPKGDPFDIDYVAHEMGHQFGGLHTFNNSCESNRSGSSSYEPGSGSTIMAYAGICAPNVQTNSDAYFHAISIDQINNYTLFNTGNTCPTKIETTNLNAPVVNAGADYTIPKDTPFELEGIASDVQSDKSNLTYCWEQYDREIVVMPPNGTVITGPTFRSVSPSKNPTRVFPNLNNIVRNTKNTWEVLPKVPRNLNFRLTVRDNDAIAGRSTFDAMKITVANDGPFSVTHPDTAKIVWQGGQNQTVKWNVSATNAGVINTPQVMILLSSDGGYTYPDTLAKAVSNTGSAIIKVPEKNIAKARIKIKGVNNIFFDISNNDFVIEKPLFPSFTLSTANANTKVCQLNKDSVSYKLEVGSIANFNEKVKLTTKGLPPNALLYLSKDTITPNGTITITVYNLKKATAGIFTLNVIGQSGALKDSVALGLTVFNKITENINLQKPLAYEKGFGTKAPFTWRKLNQADFYNIEISKNSNFQPLVENATISDTQYVAKNLVPIQIYYWRIKATNPCGQTDWIQPTIFQTGVPLCDTILNTNPVTIPATINEISSKIEVTRKAKLSKVTVYTRIDHTYLSDLEATIESPDGTNVTLFSGICTDKNNTDATFDDNGAAVNCTTAAITLRGQFKPQEPLATFNGEAMRGNWTLRIKDNKIGDAGALKSWNLSVCNDIIADENFLVETDTLITLAGETTNITQDNFVATSIGSFPDKISFKILTLPKNGILKKGSATLSVGSIITQQEINTGALFYSCDINTNFKRDSFTFESLSEKGGWIPSSTFHINITTNNIKLTVGEAKNVSCFGGNDGKITINETGGQAPVTYTLNNGIAQNSNEFNNLVLGLYTITVKDALGFTNKIKVTITEPSAIKASAKKDSTYVKIDITGGTPPYQINYDKKGFSANQSFANQSLGWHFYTVKDANNCEIKDSFELLKALNFSLITKNNSCSGIADGNITIDATGGTPPYQYGLSINNFQQNNTFSNLGAGIYSVAVKDAEGSIKTVNAIVEAPKPIVATAKTQKDSLILTTTGGTPPYQYSIDNGMTFQNGAFFLALSNGVYSIVIKDKNNCVASIKNYQFTDIVENIAQLGINITPNPAIDLVRVQFETAFEEDTKVSLLNTQGQTLLLNNIAKGATLLTLDVGHLPRGFYFITLKNTKFEINQKILVHF